MCVILLHSHISLTELWITESRGATTRPERTETEGNMSSAHCRECRITLKQKTGVYLNDQSTDDADNRKHPLKTKQTINQKWILVLKKKKRPAKIK